MSSDIPSATCAYCTQKPTYSQCLSDSPELLWYVLGQIENIPTVRRWLNEIVRARYYTRHGHPPRAMFRAFCLKYLLNEPFTKTLVIRLGSEAGLRELCGLDNRKGVPSESTFSRFFKSISESHVLQDAMFAVVEELHERLPDLGKDVAIDSTDIGAWANPNRPKGEIVDQTARWGHRTTKNKNASAGSEDREFVFGYKVHLIADVRYGVPLAYIVLPANASDSTTLPAVVDKALERYEWLSPDHLMADRGYDSQANHKFLYEDRGIRPVIHMRKPPTRRGQKSLYDGIYDHKGRPTCPDGETPMEYVQTDPKTGRHQFRCPPGGCALKPKSSGAMLYCNPAETHWEDPADNLRVLGVVARDSDEWKALYAKRQTIERVFGSLKRSRILDQHQYLTDKKIAAHIAFSTLTYAATMLARVDLEGVDTIRNMRLSARDMTAKAA